LRVRAALARPGSGTIAQSVVIAEIVASRIAAINESRSALGFGLVKPREESAPGAGLHDAGGQRLFDAEAPGRRHSLDPRVQALGAAVHRRGHRLGVRLAVDQEEQLGIAEPEFDGQ
jgi:hypothetical protein